MKIQLPATVVHIVTFNSATTIRSCLESVTAQEGYLLGQNLSVIISDNNSLDSTVEIVTTEIVRAYTGKGVELIQHSANQGFCRGHNLGISRAISAGAQLILVLNPDLRLESNMLSEMASSLLRDPRAGTATPKLLRADAQLQPLFPRVIDAAGIYFTPNVRHLDRGSGQPDAGQFGNPCAVFGGTGAALLLRREFVIDASRAQPLPATGSAQHYELFDESFFAYREDADLAWRAQSLGWRCIYVPTALGYHQRVVLPERRESLPAKLNLYGVRNRFLLQWKNLCLSNLLRCNFSLLLRNLLVIGGVLVRERSSIPGLLDAVRLVPHQLKWRREITKKRRVAPFALNRWFSATPHIEPLLSKGAQVKPITEVTVVVVCYRSGSVLNDCLASLVETSGALSGRRTVKVVVVDNGAPDEQVSAAVSQFSSRLSLTIIQPTKNVGFAGGVNLGARSVGCSTPERSAVLVLNPDVALSATAVDRLSDALEQYENLAAVSPLLVSSDGSPQLGFVMRRLPTVGSTLAELLLLHRLWPGNPWTTHHRMLNDKVILSACTAAGSGDAADLTHPHEPLDTPLLCEQPAGAALLIRRSIFDQLSGFDEQFWPAWFEDVDLCQRINLSGGLAAVLPAATAMHQGGHSLSAITGEQFASAWYGNLLRYWRKHGSIAQYAAVRVAVSVGLLIRAVLTWLVDIRGAGGSAKPPTATATNLLKLAIRPVRKL